MLHFPSPEKILLLAVLALVVLGPTRLPAAARTAGKWIAELRKLTSRFQEEVSGVLAEPKDMLTASLGDLGKEVGGWRNEMADLTRSLTTTKEPTPLPPEPANGALYTPGGESAPSTRSPDFVSSGLAPPGLPALPPAPDDPSLN